MSSSWHIWVIRSGTFEKVKKFISDEVPGVLNYLYPKIKKEFISDTKISVKVVPLFINYLFLEVDDEQFGDVFHKFKLKSEVTTYVGKCGKEDMEEIEKIRYKEENNNKEKKFFKNDVVLIIKGPFKGYTAKVVAVSDNKASLEFSIFKRDTRIEGVTFDFIELNDN